MLKDRFCTERGVAWMLEYFQASLYSF